MSENQEPEGWGFPALARTEHYFRGIFSICGRWMYAGDLTTEPPTRDYCKQCMRLREKGK